MQEVRSGGGKRMNQLDVRGNDEPATSFKKRSKDRMNGHGAPPPFARYIMYVEVETAATCQSVCHTT